MVGMRRAGGQIEANSGRNAKAKPAKLPDFPARHPLALGDPVVASRLRALIDRTVAVGLAPPGSVLARRPSHAIALRHAYRGGAEVAFARQVAMYLAHVACGLTYGRAAQLYGRDRTTAAHACRMVEERRDDPTFDRILDLLERCVRAGRWQIDAC